MFDGEEHWIIDWVDATSGDPMADACRTYLIFRQHMARSSGIYLKAFCKEAGAKAEDVLAWLPVVTAARLTEIMEETSRGFLREILLESKYITKE